MLMHVLELDQEYRTIPAGQAEARFLLRYTVCAEEKLRPDFEGAVPFSETGKRLWFLTLFQRLMWLTETVRSDIKAAYMRARNPALALDPRLATREEKEKAAQWLLMELERTEGGVLFQAAPLLEKRLKEQTDRFVEVTRELLSRLTADWTEISRAFFAGGDPGRIVRLKTDGADPHFHGRTTCVIEAEHGAFVYKPHSCEIDALFGELVHRRFGDFLYVPRCILRPGYGYSEFIEALPVGSEAEIDRYFYRLGGACALFQALGSSDLHSENWIAQGGFPVLVDLETILTPTPAVFSDPEVWPEPAAEQDDFLYDINRSLLPSGFLPAVVHGRQLSIFLDDSENSSCLPTLNGVKRTATGHEEAICSGFSNGYDRCMELREELRQALEAFRELPVRRLLRNTNYYVQLLKRLSGTAALQSEKTQRETIGGLKDYFIRRGARYLEPVARWEEACLLEGDIPYFNADGGGCGLYGCDNLLVPDFFRISGVENALERLERLSDTEKAFELGILRQSLDRALMPVPKEEAERELSMPLPDAGVITGEQALLEAENIFRRFSDSVLTGPGRKISWLICGGTDNSLLAAKPVLFEGTMGLGVFFSAMAAVSGEEKLRRQAVSFAMACADQAERFVRHLEKARYIPEAAVPLGMSNGIGGALRALTLMERYLKDPQPGLTAGRLIKALDQAEIEEAKETDVYSGTAGLLLALCGQPESRRTETLRRQVRRAADRLTALRKPLGSDSAALWDTLGNGRPISGAGHGMAGIAAAMLGAGRLLDEPSYLTAAADALKFEHGVYSDELGTWPDLRASSFSSDAMHGLCSGAPGIGLALLFCRKQGPPTDCETQLEEDIRRALEAVLYHPPLYMDHLCCGNSAAVEFLLEASLAVPGQAQACREAAGQLLGRMLRRKKEKGDYTYFPPDLRQVFSPELMYGAAGIGYEMLRYAAPERIIPVLF